MTEKEAHRHAYCLKQQMDSDDWELVVMDTSLGWQYGLKKGSIVLSSILDMVGVVRYECSLPSCAIHSRISIDPNCAVKNLIKYLLAEKLEIEQALELLEEENYQEKEKVMTTFKLASEEQVVDYLEKVREWRDRNTRFHGYWRWQSDGASHTVVAEFMANQDGFTIYSPYKDDV